MTSCLKHRKTAVLAFGRWQARRWDGASHKVNPRVHDKGFALAALLQKFDEASLASADSSISTLSHCLQRGVGMDFDLENSYEEFLIRSPSPSYWPAEPSNFIRAQQQLADSGPRGLPLLSYPNLIVASITMTLWAQKLIISEDIATMCQKNYIQPWRSLRCFSSHGRRCVFHADIDGPTRRNPAQ